MSAKGGVMDDRVPPPPLPLGRRDSCFSTNLFDKDSYLSGKGNPKKCDNSCGRLAPGSTLLEKSVRNKNWQSGWTRRRSYKPETKASTKDCKGCHCRHDIQTHKHKALTSQVDMKLNVKEMKGNRGRKCNKCVSPQNPQEKVYRENAISSETVPVLGPGTSVIKRRMPPRSKRRAKKLSSKSTGVCKGPVEIDDDSRLSPLPQGGIRLPYKRPFYSLALHPLEIEQDLALISNFKRRRTTRGNHQMGSMADDMSSCAIILLRLKNHELGSSFNRPVAKSEWPREAKELYFLHVDSPLDLGTIQARLSSGEYTHSVLFADDVRAVFRNAAMCAPSNSPVQENALLLWRLFEEDVALYEIAATESVVVPRLPHDGKNETVGSVSVSDIAPIVTSAADICLNKRKRDEVDLEVQKSPEKKECTEGSRDRVREKLVFLPVADTAVLTFAKPRTRMVGRRKQFRSSVNGVNGERESTTSASDVARHSSNDSGKDVEEKEIQTERFESLLALEEAGRSLLQVSHEYNNGSREKRSLPLEGSILPELKMEIEKKYLPSNGDAREAENLQFVKTSQTDKELVLKLKRPRGRPSLEKNGGKKEDNLVDGKKVANCKSEQVYSRAKKGEKEGGDCEYVEKTEQRCAGVYSFLAEAVEIYSPVRGEGPKEFSLEWLHPVRTQRRRGRTVPMVAKTGRSREGRAVEKGEKPSSEKSDRRISGGEVSDGVSKRDVETKFEQGRSRGNLTSEQKGVMKGGGNVNQWKTVELEERKEETNRFHVEKLKYVLGELFTEKKENAASVGKVRDGSPVEVGTTLTEGGGFPRSQAGEEEGKAAEEEAASLLEQLKQGCVKTENEMMPKKGYSTFGEEKESEKEKELLVCVESHGESSSSARTGRPFLEKWRPLSASLAKGEGKIKSHSVFTVKQGVAVKVPHPPPTVGLSHSATLDVPKQIRAGFLKGSGTNTESADFQGGNSSLCPAESEISISNVVPPGDSSFICSKSANFGVQTQQLSSVLGSKSVSARSLPYTPPTPRIFGSIGSIVPRQTTSATWKKVQAFSGQEKSSDGIQNQCSDEFLKPSKDQFVNPNPVFTPEFHQRTISDVVLNSKKDEDSEFLHPCKTQVNSICLSLTKQITMSCVNSSEFVQNNSSHVALISDTPSEPLPSQSNSSIITEACTASVVGGQNTKRTDYSKSSVDRGNSVAGSIISVSSSSGGDKAPLQSPWLELLANALQEDDSLSEKSVRRKEKESLQEPQKRKNGEFPIGLSAREKVWEGLSRMKYDPLKIRTTRPTDKSSDADKLVSEKDKHSDMGKKSDADKNLDTVKTKSDADKTPDTEEKKPETADLDRKKSESLDVGQEALPLAVSALQSLAGSPPRDKSQWGGSLNATTLSSVAGSVVSTGRISVLDQPKRQEKTTIPSNRSQIVAGNKEKIRARKLDALSQVSELVSLERSSLGTMAGSISTPALTSV